MKRFFVLAGIAIVILCQLSCSSDEKQAQIENPAISDVTDGFIGAPVVGEVKLESMYEDEVRRLATKTPIEVITVIEGTSKVIVEAEFRRVHDWRFGFPLYECVLTDEAVNAMGGVAEGMSGSPVGISGRVFGALGYGHNWAITPHRFYVTPIEAMEATLAPGLFSFRFFSQILSQLLLFMKSRYSVIFHATSAILHHKTILFLR